MIERERTFLARFLPKGIEKCRCLEIIDIYIPASKKHPVIRIRKMGDKFELTKKVPSGNSSSIQKESTIVLDTEEFDALSRISGKKLHKIRYFYETGGRVAEIDVFLDSLKGLVTVDFEFENESEMKEFKIPVFCLADVTEEEFAAGGMLCGKSYADIENELKRFGYVKITPPAIGAHSNSDYKNL